MYFVIVIGFMILGGIVASNFKNKFARYAQIPVSSGLSGREVAEKMLRDNGIYGVKVVEGGVGTDHYDPTQSMVNLSPDVYNGRSVSAAAVAAHECGHAVQHARSYAWLNLRTTLVPVVNVANNISQFLFFGFLIAGFITGMMQNLILIYIIILGVTTIFSLVTLPVEIDASRRALAWLKTSNVTMPGEEQAAATDALKSAAYTYVIAAIGSLTLLLYMLGVFNRD